MTFNVYVVLVPLLGSELTPMVPSRAGYRVCQGAERQRSLGGPPQVFRDQARFVPSRSYTPRLLTHAMTDFIRGLLENVGAEIDPIRLIRRIKNGLEIPGLKRALIKILQDFNLQVRSPLSCSALGG